ncbi:MAG: alpha/beta hydrolase family protein [Rhizobiaceae bacterium]
MIKECVLIEAGNDWTLHGTLYAGEETQADLPAILISAAAAVPHTYYANFAKFLVKAGAQGALIYDYRGIAASAGDHKRWRSLQMKDQALLDFPAAAGFLQERFPDNTLVGLGHSYGGQALGLSGVADGFARYATVATMSGYWRSLDTPWRVWLQTQILGKSVASLLGYVPEAVSPGTTMPSGIFLDWAQWIASPDYFFSDRDLPETSRFIDVTLPYLSIGLTDDPWGTRQAVYDFMCHYTNADLRQMWIEPGESGKIGHLGYFSRRHSAALWPELRDFLLDGRWPETVAIKPVV